MGIPLRRAKDDSLEWHLGSAPELPDRAGVLVETTVEALLELAAGLTCGPGDARLGFVVGERDALAHLEDLERLRPHLVARNVALALGDIGVAYAAVGELRTHLFDLVLLDAQLCRDAVTDPAAQVLAGALIDLARADGAVVVATADDEDARQALRELGAQLVAPGPLLHPAA